jgi:hypothetical protein
LDVCVDVEPGKGLVRGPHYSVFVWPRLRAELVASLFADDEFRREALLLPASAPWNVQRLPDPYWIGADQHALTSEATTAAGSVLRSVLRSVQFKSVAAGRVPSILAIAERKPLRAWGDSAPYDLYFRFGGAELHRFEEIPGVGAIYVGRVDPTGVPLDLVPGNIHLECAGNGRPSGVVRHDIRSLPAMGQPR